MGIDRGTNVDKQKYIPNIPEEIQKQIKQAKIDGNSTTEALLTKLLATMTSENTSTEQAKTIISHTKQPVPTPVLEVQNDPRQKIRPINIAKWQAEIAAMKELGEAPTEELPIVKPPTEPPIKPGILSTLKGWFGSK